MFKALLIYGLPCTQISGNDSIFGFDPPNPLKKGGLKTQSPPELTSDPAALKDTPSDKVPSAKERARKGFRGIHYARQLYFKVKKVIGKFDLEKFYKPNNHYKVLYSQAAQHILRTVAESFKSYSGLIKALRKQVSITSSKLRTISLERLSRGVLTKAFSSPCSLFLSLRSCFFLSHQKHGTFCFNPNIVR